MSEPRDAWRIRRRTLLVWLVTLPMPLRHLCAAARAASPEAAFFTDGTGFGDRA